MSLQSSKFRDLSLQFVYLKTCHYNFPSTRLMSFSTLPEMFGPLADCIIPIDPSYGSLTCPRLTSHRVVHTQPSALNLLLRHRLEVHPDSRQPQVPKAVGVAVSAGAGRPKPPPPRPLQPPAILRPVAACLDHASTAQRSRTLLPLVAGLQLTFYIPRRCRAHVQLQRPGTATFNPSHA